MNMRRNSGWMSDYKTLRATPSGVIVQSLKDFLDERNPAQITSWTSTVPIIQTGAAYTMDSLEAASRFSAILEFELPREGGRRPDVVALQNGVVLVLEFKAHAAPLPQHIDQTLGYARDLKNYHEMTHE